MFDSLRCTCSHLRILHGNGSHDECRIGSCRCTRFRWQLLARLTASVTHIAGR